MTRTILRLSTFEVHRLRNIVGQGHASPYHISIFCSDLLGTIGAVIDPSQQVAANDYISVPKPAAATSWLQRTKPYFGLNQN